MAPVSLLVPPMLRDIVRILGIQKVGEAVGQRPVRVERERAQFSLRLNLKGVVLRLTVRPRFCYSDKFRIWTPRLYERNQAGLRLVDADVVILPHPSRSDIRRAQTHAVPLALNRKVELVDGAVVGLYRITRDALARDRRRGKAHRIRIGELEQSPATRCDHVRVALRNL